MGWSSRVRHKKRQAHAVAKQAKYLRAMPPRVARFYLRAWITLMRTHDGWSSIAVTRPRDVVRLLKLADGRRAAVELGTGTAWTTTALALADDQRRVVSYDPVAREERERYLALVPSAVARAGSSCTPCRPSTSSRRPARSSFLFIDTEHDRITTGESFRRWEPALRPAAAVRSTRPATTAHGGRRCTAASPRRVAELGLEGVYGGGIFVWRKP